MPVYPEAPRKEASSFSLNDIQMLLNQMSDKEKPYSLRARSLIRMVNGKQETVHVLFLRNGNESVFERLDNWWNAKAQRALARTLICTALAERPASAATGRMAMRTLVHERALLHVRKKDKILPVEIRTLFSACSAAQKDMLLFENKLLSISAEDRQKFQEFNQHFNGVRSQGAAMPSVWELLQENHESENPINAILAEAESHYLSALLQAVMQFTEVVAGNRPRSDIDLALVQAFIDRRKALRQGEACGPANMANTARPGMPVSERAAEFWLSIDQLLDIWQKIRCAPTPTLTPTLTPTPSGGERTALVPTRSQPPASRFVPELRPASLPALQASLFQSLWACSAGRSAGAVYAASKVLMPAARKMVSRAALAAALAKPAKPAKPAMELVRMAMPAPKPIRPALSPQEIVCDCQGELDLADIDSEAVILIASEGGLFSMSPACHQWLAALGRIQHAEEAHFVRVQHQARTVLLARAQRSPMHGRLDGAAIRKLAEIYQAAVACAVGQNRPICLTDLFDDDPHTADQCVEAMLAPVRRCYQQGMRPAIHIRVGSPRLRQRIVAALGVLLATPPARPAAVEVVDCVTDADRQLPGLIMLSGESADPLHRNLARRHAQHARSTAPGAAAASRVAPRKSLGGDTRTHLYFYAQPCPPKNGLPDGERIAGEYAALFAAARKHQCKCVTLEILPQTAGHERRLAAALSAAIMAARAITPDLAVRIVTRNKQIREIMEGYF